MKSSTPYKVFSSLLALFTPKTECIKEEDEKPCDSGYGMLYFDIDFNEDNVIVLLALMTLPSTLEALSYLKPCSIYLCYFAKTSTFITCRNGSSPDRACTNVEIWKFLLFSAKCCMQTTMPTSFLFYILICFQFLMCLSKWIFKCSKVMCDDVYSIFQYQTSWNTSWCYWWVFFSPEINSINKLQMSFTSQTLTLTNSHKFKFDKSLYKSLQLQASNFSVHGILLSFFPSRTSHAHSTIAKKYSELMLSWLQTLIYL